MLQANGPHAWTAKSYPLPMIGDRLDNDLIYVADDILRTSNELHNRNNGEGGIKKLLGFLLWPVVLGALVDCSVLKDPDIQNAMCSLQ